ncbi:MAG: two-component sensor histidine kinase [Burkholderiales bacterium RIFCSPHIGHO2_12_FULL_65_48]|nr:MAG: two-component sensor histidine kinase [Burkholderiales bacterium RIFCSPHIGHO2_12_FULL_65_48]OGB11643.1 MAG: two-component sensor histidine kinase [Burkholderiales bacterium RIFCSPHIGHO2_02_FULL_64_19]OGB53709.1 MAG: two-component sensor histidine kinase [Burkholderiales bacterium RIFCSPLOWO2_12_FULL_64_33]
MPHLTLHRKAFIALAALLVALLLIFAGFSRLGLQRGLGPYVAEIELARMDWLAERLQAHHTQTGGWDTLRNQPRLWGQLSHPGSGLRRSNTQGAEGTPPTDRSGSPGTPPELANGNPAADRSMQQPPPPPPDGGPPPGERGAGGPQRHPDDLFPRLGLVDAQQHLVVGTAPQPGGARLALTGADGKTIGQLVLAPPQGVRSEADQAFLAQHLGFVAWTGLAGLALALLLSGWLARRWLAPVEALANGARGIAQGHLHTRVHVHGNDELAQLARTFNTMAEQLSSIEASRRQWLGDVAHELRTPLAAMRAEIEAVQDGIRPFDDKTALRLHRQVMRLIQLVGDLRASLDAAGTSAPSAQVPVHPLSLLNEAIASMRPRLAQAGIDVDTTGLDALTAQAPAQPAPLVRGDAQQLHQVFLNVLENSLRYTDAGGLLRLSARLLPPADGAAQLQVQLDDSAPGVPAHELPRIFDRLYRAETSRNRDHGGSGLGLAICRAIVLAHGGTLTADTSPLGGLRITLQLPLLDNPS